MMRNINSYRLLLGIVAFAFTFSSCTPDQENHLSLQWKKQASGVWNCSIGKKEKIDLLSAAGIQPKIEALNQKNEVAFPLNDSLIKATSLNGKLYLRFPLDAEEQIYGLGLQFKEVNRRQKVFQLHVDHYGGKDNGRTHAPVPFYVSSKGYGILINSARYLTVYVGTAVRLDSPNQPEVRDRNTDKAWTSRPQSDAVEILVPAEGVEVIVFGGESPLDAVSRYNLYCGGGCLPPKWGLGFTYRTHRLYSAEDVINEAKEFEQKKFPLDFIGLEPGWQSMSYPCTYEWDSNRFPHPKQFVETLLQMNVKTNLWLNPYVAPKASLYPRLLPYAGSHSVWTGIVPDYSIPEARRVFMAFYEKNQLDLGVSGVKIDECDGYDHWLWPDVATFPSGLEAEQMRQTYGLIKDQYLFGENLLVAPMFAGQASRKIILPIGKWYDFYTGNYAGESEIIEVKPSLEKIPLFVKAGSIIPLIPPRLHAPKHGEILPLEIRHYGTSEGKFMLYDDDGETFAYENGAYSWTELRAVKRSDGALDGQIKRLDDHIYNYGQAEWVFMSK